MTRIAFVRAVMAASTRRSSRLSVSALMSTNTGRAPRSTKAFAEDTNVNDGMMTSSPGSMSSSSAAISRAAVHDCVSSTRGAPIRRSSQSWHSFVNRPFPASWHAATASWMCVNSLPVR